MTILWIYVGLGIVSCAICRQHYGKGSLADYLSVFLGWPLLIAISVLAVLVLVVSRIEKFLNKEARF